MGLILNSGHRVVYRAPYWAVDGSIEYVFNTIHSLVEVLFNTITTLDELKAVVDDIVTTMPSFQSYFEHVGFNYNI